MRRTAVKRDRIRWLSTGPAGTRFDLAGRPEAVAAVAFPLRLPFAKRSLCWRHDIPMLPETPEGEGGYNGSSGYQKADKRWAREPP